MKKINLANYTTPTNPAVLNPRAYDWLNSQKYVWTINDLLRCPNPRALKN